jgi:hypothetical protein
MTRILSYGASLVLIVMLLFAATLPINAQQSFSCPWGTEAACLDYGDKVCSSLGKCVDESATCFQAYTCNYQGFVCKSDYEEAVDEYNSLLNRYNSLINEYNSLLLRHDENVENYNQLLSRHTELASCLSYADTLEEAKNCSW